MSDIHTRVVRASPPMSLGPLFLSWEDRHRKSSILGRAKSCKNESETQNSQPPKSAKSWPNSCERGILPSSRCRQIFSGINDRMAPWPGSWQRGFRRSVIQDFFASQYQSFSTRRCKGHAPQRLYASHGCPDSPELLRQTVCFSIS